MTVAAPTLALLLLSLSPLGDGASARMPDMKGRVVLMEFWTTTCGPCRTWKPVFEKLDKKYSTRGLSILSIDTGEEPELAKKYLETHATTLKVFSDPSGTAQRRLGQIAQPAMALFDDKGNLMWTAVGFGPSTEADMTCRIERYLPEETGGAKP
ncbi:MAG: TlpA disulfide reductase family protein [Elusimicrobiota bacterium]|nr:TlpA disulfide reductase family protein [Elusimicrobiota bacterium]